MVQLLTIDLELRGVDQATVDLHTGLLAKFAKPATLEKVDVTRKYILDGVQSYFCNLFPISKMTTWKSKKMQLGNSVHQKFIEAESELQSGDPSVRHGLLKDIPPNRTHPPKQPESPLLLR